MTVTPRVRAASTDAARSGSATRPAATSWSRAVCSITRHRARSPSSRPSPAAILLEHRNDGRAQRLLAAIDLGDSDLLTRALDLRLDQCAVVAIDLAGEHVERTPQKRRADRAVVIRREPHAYAVSAV
jgi:hypothetical protein